MVLAAFVANIFVQPTVYRTLLLLICMAGLTAQTRNGFGRVVQAPVTFIPPPGLHEVVPFPLERHHIQGHLPDAELKKDRANRGLGQHAAGPSVSDRTPAPMAPASGGGWASVGYTGWLPPDGAIAAGPNHVVAAVNSSLAIFTKTGASLSTSTLKTIFQGLGNAEESIFDPRLLYDAGSGRFFLLAAARLTASSMSWYYLAVSHTSNPMDGWYIWGLHADWNGTTQVSNWADFPGLGVDSSAIYFTSNQFGWDGAWNYAKIRILGKTQLLNGSAVITWSDFWNVTDPTNGFPAASLQPAHTFSPSPGEFVAAAGGGHTLTVWLIQNPLSSPPTLSTTSVEVGSFGVPPDAEQLGSSTLVETTDARLQNLVWRNNQLWTTHTVNTLWPGDTQSRAGIRLYRMDTSSFPALTVLDNFVYGVAQLYYYAPSIQTNDAGDVALVFNRSGSSEYVGLRYTGRLAAEPPNTLQVSATLKAGEGVYSRVVSGSNRWGDYSAISVDPSGSAIWMFGPYAAAGNLWSTFSGVVYGVLPANEESSAATNIPSLPFTTSQDTRLATTASGDPVHSCTGQKDAASVWYSWTAAATETVIVDTFGSAYDTVLSVYLASNMQERACNNDAGGGSQSQVSFQATAGETYLIEASSAGTFGGSLVLNATNDLVPPTATVQSPNGGEYLFSGTPFLITWNSSDNVGVTSQDILLSTNGGLTFPTTVATGLPGNATSYNWTPSVTTSTGRIKVVARDAANNAGSDISNTNFLVLTGTPYVRVSAPNTTVNWGIGSRQTIYWTSNLGSAARVDLEISRDGGTTFTAIALGLANTGSTTWVVTGPSTSTARIRVKWSSNNSIADASDVNFTIADPFLAITTPNTSTSQWGIGTLQAVTWSTNLGPADNVRLSLSTDGGVTFPVVLAANIANDKTETITVGNNPSSQARVRVEWLANPAVTDMSNFNFVIATPYLTLTKPNGGENWAAGSTQIWTWTNNLGSKENISLELSTDGGATWQLMRTSTPSDGSESIVMPSGNSATCLARATWIGHALTDVSNAVFTISPPTLTLTAPNGGDTWLIGSTRVVTWSSNIGGYVRLDLSTDGGATWQVLAASVSNVGSRSVVVPSQATTQALVRVSSLAAGFTSYVDTSNAVFAIAQPQVTLLAPNGGEIWTIGTVHQIQWTSNVTGNIKIEISRDAGATWTIFASYLANTGSYNWTVTSPASTNCLIRASSYSFPAATDTSNAVFTIQ